MRKKKHLEERLEAVGDVIRFYRPDDLNRKTAVLIKECIDFDVWFGAGRPLHIEIGAGRGGFALEYAKRNPDINLLAIEKNSNAIVGACEKAARENISNLRFMICDAEYLERYIPPAAVSRIFLNFSCPFPKKAYAVHRLTHRTFAAAYGRILTPDGEIHQKTDDRQLFEFSIEELTASGFALKNISLDLHNSGFEGNIETEYEQRFAKLGKPIYRLEAYLRKTADCRDNER